MIKQDLDLSSNSLSDIEGNCSLASSAFECYSYIGDLFVHKVGNLFWEIEYQS